MISVRESLEMSLAEFMTDVPDGWFGQFSDEDLQEMLDNIIQHS